jgi:N-dimethylarginine dimethylaminohydrolase
LDEKPRRKTILMCPPDHFGVAYVINPWMEGQTARTDPTEARKQWLGLKALIEPLAEISVMAPQPALPDLVFTANAGFPIGRQVVVSRFRCPERRGEEPFFRAFFAARGFDLIDPPDELHFEGAGDALHDAARDLIWVGHGFRSHEDIAPFLEARFAKRAISLALADPRFYHLDTCLCPLPDGYLMYFAGAFDAASRARIEAIVPEGKRICVEAADAETFCCNAVALDRKVILNQASPALQARLRQAGLTPALTPLTQFIKAGGAAKCLTLEIQ